MHLETFAVHVERFSWSHVRPSHADSARHDARVTTTIINLAVTDILSDLQKPAATLQ